MKGILRQLTELMMFCVPMSVLWVDHGASISASLLVIISLVGLISYRSIKIDMSRDEVFLLLLFLMFFLYSVLSLWSGMEALGVKHIGKHFAFALFIPAYLWMRRVQPKSSVLWSGVIAGAIISTFVVFFSDRLYGDGRVHGALHPILFGDISLVLGFMSYTAKDVFKEKFITFRYLPVIALFSGVIASIMSGSRGAWIALPMLALVLIVAHWREGSAKYKAAIVSIVFILPVLIYFLPVTGVEKRIDAAWSNVDNYISGQQIDTSLGIRFESWKAAYYMAEEHPLLGVGLGNFQQEAKALVQKGMVTKGADRFDHTHNDFFYQLAENGLIGLILLILLFVYPFRLFYKNTFSNDVEIKAFSVAGMCLVVAFVHFSLSETLMIRSSSVSFYGFFVITLLALMNNKLSKNI